LLIGWAYWNLLQTQLNEPLQQDYHIVSDVSHSSPNRLIILSKMMV
jgi:hypothetical protein